MKIEHIAFPALHPVEVAAWYVENLGMRIVRETGAPTYTHFLADEAGSIFEIYNNPQVAVPDYAAMDALLLHIAFSVENIEVERQRLLDVGCTPQDEVAQLPNGDLLAMLRDPWGLSLQLVKRAQAMI